jgi:O-antigen ligase
MVTATALPVLAVAHGLGGAAEKAGVVAVALLAGAFVLGAGRLRERGRAIGALAAIVLTPVLLVADIWNTSQLHHLRSHPAEALAAVLAGLIVLAGLVVVIRRRPNALALLAVAAVPFRLPISTGGTTSNLLIPLYLVVGAGTLTYVLPRLRSRSAAPPATAPAGSPRADSVAGTNGDRAVGAEPEAGWVEWLLIGFVALYALQAIYSSDFSKALENVVFFYIPFALLFGLLRRVRWTRELLLACLGIAVVEAALFAGVGFVEYGRKHLLLNPKVVQANQYDNYFRVNSLFFDPSIYGRFLALVMLAVTTVVLWTRRRRDVLIGGAVLLWLLAALVTSFSQSSIAALLLGLVGLAAWRWSARDTLLVTVLVAAVGLLVLIFAPSGTHLGFSGSKSADNATSGRASLVTNGLALFGDRPVQGYGSGSFPLEYRRHDAHANQADATSASHTIPITVAAEQGLLGLAVYIALLLAAFTRLYTGAGRSPARIALAACFTALVAHTFAYADFLEDPITWTLLAIGLGLAGGDGRRLLALSLRRRSRVPDARAATGAATGATAP